MKLKSPKTRVCSPKMKENMNIVLVGHKDHGKSTLIGRLFYDTDSLSKDRLEDAKDEKGRIQFQYVMDHLKEEREQGITIDTAQTYFSTEKRNYTIIDAPGHKQFIKNMMTGASQAESAILVVSAFEGVEAQTKRHAYVLSLLGIEQVIVAINKMDLVDYKQSFFKRTRSNVKKFLKKIGLKSSKYIPISAREGDNVAEKSGNMKWYDRITILQALDKFKTQAEPIEKPFRFPVQDVYERNGEEIAVGRVETGKIEEGQKVVVMPKGEKTKIKEVKEWEKDPEEAMVGKSSGLVLTEDVKRGDIISDLKNRPIKKETLNANLFWLAPEPIRAGEEVIFRCTTQEAGVVLDKIKRRIDASTLETIEEDADKIKRYEVGEVVLKLDKPVAVDAFNEIKQLGRFVIEKNNRISGGGIILFK